MEEGGGAAGKRAPGLSAAPPATPNPRADAGDERDQDMDEFYALLGNIRAVRELLRTPTERIRNANKRRKVEPAPLWRPTFAMEDFASASVDPSPSSSDRKGKKVVEEEEEGGGNCKSVDLSLSL